MAEHRLREFHDLLGRAISDLQRFDLDMGQRQLAQQVIPASKAVVHVQPLGDVARQRDALATADRLREHGQLDGAQILCLVDQDVLVAQCFLSIWAQQRSTQTLTEPE